MKQTYLGFSETIFLSKYFVNDNTCDVSALSSFLAAPSPAVIDSVTRTTPGPPANASVVVYWEVSNVCFTISNANIQM